MSSACWPSLQVVAQTQRCDLHGAGSQAPEGEGASVMSAFILEGQRVVDLKLAAILLSQHHKFWGCRHDHTQLTSLTQS